MEPTDAAADEPQSPEKDRNFVTALARGLELLRAFGTGEEYLGNAELSNRTHIPRPTVSRLTYTLTQLGYLQHNRHLEKYRLGQVCWRWVTAFWPIWAFAKLLAPIYSTLPTPPTAT